MFSTAESEPGWPLDWETMSPGSRPASELEMVAMGATVRSSDLTLAMEPVSVLFFWVP